jgi:signal transduction histidine kinase
MQAETRASGEALLAQAQAMAQQIEVQLARARSAAGGKAGRQASPLGEVLVPLFSAMAKLHPDKRFMLTGRAGIMVPVDAVDLTELLSILLDNAGKWARAQVVIALDGASLTITDDGAGMEEDEIARAFEIGTRFDPSVAGSGLGLAIARDIAEAYGLGLSLRRGSARGLVAEIRFPAGA